MVKGTEGNMFDEYLRLGAYRRSYEKNRRITDERMEIAAQAPSRAPRMPKGHVYGKIHISSPWDNVKAVTTNWQTFDQDKQLALYTNHAQTHHAIQVNMAALDAGITDAKPWNEYCMKNRKVWYYKPEHTQKFFLAKRKVKVPELEYRDRQDRHEMNRVVSHDYGRNWLLKEDAQTSHRKNGKEINSRMLGRKFNADTDRYHAHHAAHILMQNKARMHLNSLVQLPEMTPPKIVRNAKSHLVSFRVGDKHKKGWRPDCQTLCQWRAALDPLKSSKMARRGAIIPLADKVSVPAYFGIHDLA